MQDQSELSKQFLDLIHNCQQDHILDDLKKYNISDQKQLEQQILNLDKTCPGGLVDYVQRARKLLQESKVEFNPYSDYSAEIPNGYNITFSDLENIKAMEKIGIEEVKDTCFVLVAGGLGERLGYNGIKIGIPLELITKQTFIEYYFNYIHAFQSKCPKGTVIPVAIMTSDDTHDLTVELLRSNNYFTLKQEQVTLMKQQKVPSMCDNNAKFVLEKNSPRLETKPHGHGDVHSLLYQTGLIQNWKNLNKKWAVFFQDTNPLCFRALPSVLGISKNNNLIMNSMAIPRKPGEAMGAICKLASKTGQKSMIINVEYNQLGALIKNEPLDKQGYSLYPGNINCMVFSLPEYCQTLVSTKGVIPEFVNPKYADSAKTKFTSPTRLECMMQDYPKLIGSADRIGFTQIDREFCFTTLKNNLQLAAQKQLKNIATECVASCESDFYKLNAKLLTFCDVVIRAEDDNYEFEKIKVNFGPRIVLDPHTGVTIQELQDNIKGKIQIIGNSTLVLKGHLQIENLYLDGILQLEGCGSFKNIIVRDKQMHRFVPVDITDKSLPPYLQIRGYDVKVGKQLTDLSTCQIPSHEKYPIIAVNIGKDFSGGHRLVCAKCICEDQCQFAQKCVFIRDIFSQESKTIKGWHDQKIEDRVGILDNQLLEGQFAEEFDVEQINYVMDEAEENVCMQKDVMKEQFSAISQERQKIVNGIRNKFQELYDLKQIFKILKSYSKKEINLATLNEKINVILRQPTRSEIYKEMTELYRTKEKVCPIINKKGYIENVQQILEQVNLLSQVVQTLKWYFVVPKINLYNSNLKTLSFGKQLQFNNLDSQQYIYGSQPFKNHGTQSWIYLIDDYPSNSYNSIYIGIVNDNRKDDINGIFGAGFSVYVDIVNQAQSQYFTASAGKKILSEVFKKNQPKPFKIMFKWDPDNKLFQINDECMESVYVYSMEKIQKQVRGNNQYQISLYNNLFMKETKIRPFIMSYQANFKLTLLDC